MDAYRRVKLCLGGASTDGYGHTLNDLARIRPHHVDCQHNVVTAPYNHLHERPFLTPGQGVLHRFKRGFIDIQVAAMSLHRLSLGRTDGADIWLTKNRRRDVVIVEVLFRSVGEQVVGDAHAFFDGHGGELYAIRNVTNRIDIVDAGLIVIINQDLTAVTKCNPRRL